MNESKEISVLKSKVENRLQRIANVLLLNASFIDNLGLLNGKMGIAIFFYQYSRYTGSKIFGDYAGELIDEIYEEININTPVDFANGLTGIGWGIEYLVKSKFLEADTDEALSEIDNTVYRHRLQNPILLGNSNDMFGYGFYYLARIMGHEKGDDNLNTLIKKYHLIFLTDECERILLQKLYTRYNIESLSTGTINSFIWFLLEMHRLKIFPVKVEKVLKCVPEFIEKGLQDFDDIAGQLLLLNLTEKTVQVVTDKSLRNLLRDLLKKKNGEILVGDSSDETAVDNFIKNTWQQLVYQPYFTYGKEVFLQIGKIFSIVDDEKNWNNRLDNLTRDNIGLTGFTGLGLGLLFYRMNEELRTTKSEIRTENIKEHIG